MRLDFKLEGRFASLRSQNETSAKSDFNQLRCFDFWHSCKIGRNYAETVSHNVVLAAHLLISPSLLLIPTPNTSQLFFLISLNSLLKMSATAVCPFISAKSAA